MRSLGVALAFLAACGSPPAKTSRPTVEQQVMAAADAVLECMGNGGATCLYPTESAAAWVAQTDLELIAGEPPPLLPDPLLRAAGAIGATADGNRTVAAESERAAPLTRDLSCRSETVRNAGAEYRARREALIDRAENLGLGSTRAGAAVAALAAAAAPVDGTKLVRARCRRGELFVLLSPPSRELDPDEDPRAHAGGGWRAFLVSYDDARVMRGPREPAPAPKPIVDPVPADIVDPWIPVTEVEL